jgi:DNA-binding NtrC family response regulator
MATAGAVQRGWVGARLIESACCSGGCEGDHLFAARLGALGFHVLRPHPDGAPRVPADRHVALIVSSDQQAAIAACWMRQLTARSARGHLVVDRRSRSGTRSRCGACARSVRRDLDRALRCLLVCRFDEAEAQLSGLEVAAELRGERLVSHTRVVRALLHFCQGRFEEARRQVEAPCGPYARSVRILLAWATFDTRALSRFIGRSMVGPRRARRTGRPALDRMAALLAASLSGAPDRVRRVLAVHSLRTPAGRTPRLPAAESWRERVDRLLIADACWSVGWRAAAARALGPRAVWHGASPLEQLFAAWVRANVEDGNPSRAVVWRERGRASAPGVRRFALGRHVMHLLHAVPDLLYQVNEADDELEVLTRACRWVAQHCEAAAVGFLDLAQGALLAGGPAMTAALSANERRDLATCDRPRAQPRPDGLVVAAPVRYAGVRIGVIVVIGAAVREATLKEAALSVAALCAPALRTRLDAIALRGESHARTPEILGRSPAIAALREAITRAAGSPFPVLVEGESGSGKELVARAIHRLSARRDRRFAALNCAALSDELAETELFGHARGAFTGAIGPRAGLFEEAHLGTLFLDEAADLSARTQARLLRALQEREVRRLGENTPRAVDVRIVAASNRPLAELVLGGQFRQDLLFRLAVIRIGVPALRDRPEDVPLLALTCWRRMGAELSIRAILGADALARLARHAWPGNVRELQNVMAALAVSAPARGRVSARHVDQVLAHTGRTNPSPVLSLDSARAECERRTVAAALARHGGRRASAARELGLTRQGLAKAIKRLDLEVRLDPPVAGEVFHGSLDPRVA